jgi:hypothetical protein
MILSSRDYPVGVTMSLILVKHKIIDGKELIEVRDVEIDGQPHPEITDMYATNRLGRFLHKYGLNGYTMSGHKVTFIKLPETLYGDDGRIHKVEFFIPTDLDK